ncbi:MAG: hypothetical protein QG602_1948 [Verrucomicrobiota bacterium]|nr:hypothetical protein [Verrucomicrobiota bacterium]
MQNRLLTLTLTAPCATAFNFLADIENLPAWTGGLCEWVELHREGWWAYTALGELAVETKVDDIAGEIDLCLRHVSGWQAVIPLRVRSDGDGGAIVRAACRQPVGLSDDDYERLVESLLNGLRDLAVQFHPEPVAA